MKLLPCQLFQLTSPRGGWHSADLPNTTHGIFQLTSSRGGWQWCMLLLMKKMYFNSHPHKEDDVVADIIGSNVLISTHILTRRMTTAGVNLIFQLAFQLTSSQGGWRGNFSFGSDQLKLFQLTSSRGGWQDYLLCLQKQQKFQLTSSRGGWRAAGGNRQSQERFQLTSSRGGWLHPFPMLQNHQHFNSHPHEEDDYDSVL